MLTGILAGLGAGAFWGMAFLAPLAAPGFDAVDITVGRFVACGLFSLALMLTQPLVRSLRGRATTGWHLPTPRQALAALVFSVLGYTGYYLLLALAITQVGAALPVLVIGTIPIWLMVLGKPHGLRWSALLPGVLLTAGGIALMMESPGDAAGSGGPLVLGMLYAGAAVVSWLAFAMLNAAWLRRHPGVQSTDWANWMGVGAGVGALLLWWWAGTDWNTLWARPGVGGFVLVCVLTGIGSAWVASVLWNMASRRLSGSLAGQLIVSETIFGLLYSFAWDQQWPATTQWLAAAMFVLGILLSIKAHR